MQTRQKEILGHPRGLFVLFFSEMWERFSYYGMRALLVLYMTQYLFVEVREHGKHVWGYDTLSHGLTAIFGEMSLQAYSSQIYGLYTGLVYFTPLFGGYIADRYWGHRRSVYAGGFLMAIGHFMMAFESMFFPALLFLILGNGLFKPNLVSQVGNLYKPEDARKDRAYMIYYMGVNLGALMSPLVCGTLGQKYGWHYGFGAAGVGMLVGLAVYHFGRKSLPADLVEQREAHRVNNTVAVHEPITKQDYTRIAALVFLCIVNVAFWAVYEQQGNTLQLWADSKIDWNVLGFLVPSTWYQSLNPVFILLLTPVITRFWLYQSKKKSEPTSVSKMGIGCLLLGFSFLMMYGCVDIIGAGKGSLWWLVGTVLILTAGELYLSPVGLSFVSKLSPLKLVSMLMGMWFMSSFFGNILAGYLGTFYETMGQKNFFMMLATVSLIAAVVFFVVNLPLKKLMHKDTELEAPLVKL